MYKIVTILLIVLVIASQHATVLGQKNGILRTVDFYGDSFQFETGSLSPVDFPQFISERSIMEFVEKVDKENNHPALTALNNYKNLHKPDDWLFYQLVRKVAQQISPKNENYYRYTLYKWFLLAKSGYEVMLTTSGKYLLFYVQSDEKIYNIPARMKDGKQFVCLNSHDYDRIDFEKNIFSEIPLYIPEGTKGFSYKVTQLPDFKSAKYVEKDIEFKYYENNYHFKVKLNPDVQVLFGNYPVVDYATYLNIPLSRETYQSLIPELKKSLKGLSERNGIDYLMRFTRYAFLYKPDAEIFGDEKRFTAEQTLFYNQSDCEDRVGLFFYLVKEIYNVPMIVLTSPEHVTIAVQFEKPKGKGILYNGHIYTVCEPTPQKQDLTIGQMIPGFRKTSFEVAYAYSPTK